MSGRDVKGAGYVVFLTAWCLCVGALAGQAVRPPAVAGSWYPGEAGALADYVDGLLAKAQPAPAPAEVRALILPHAGYRFSGATAAAAVGLVEGRPFKRVILLGPSHRVAFHGLSIAEVAAYATPLGSIPVDADAVARLRKSPLVTTVPQAHRHEHSLEMELPLLQRALPAGWKLVPVLVGRMEAGDYAKAADLLRPLADADTLVVVSSDFTHYGRRYGYLPFPVDVGTPERLKELDQGALKPILARNARDFLAYRQRTGDTICGYGPIAILLHMLSGEAVGQAVSYTTSGAQTGDYRQSVSYFAIVFRSDRPLAASPAAAGETTTPAPGDLPTDPAPSARLSESDLRLLHRIAVEGVTAAASGKSLSETEQAPVASPQDLPPELKHKAGAFVTLWEEGRLRGCVGYTLPWKPLYQTVYENGINAAHNDLRFNPVNRDELKKLKVEISVLTPPKPVSSYKDFQVGKQGVILTKDGHQAVYLPEVASRMGWSREETLTRLALKAGLEPDAWKNGAKLAVFTAQKYSAPYPAE